MTQEMYSDCRVVIREGASDLSAQLLRSYWEFDVAKGQFVHTDEELLGAGGLHEEAAEAGHLEITSARCRSCQEPVSFRQRDQFSATHRRVRHLAALGKYSCAGCLVPSEHQDRWRKGEDIEARKELVERLDKGGDFDSLPVRSLFSLAAVLSHPDMQQGGPGISMLDIESKVGIPQEEFSTLYRSFAITVAPDGITTRDFAPKSRHGFNFEGHVPHIVNAWRDQRSFEDLLVLVRGRVFELDQSLIDLWFACCEVDVGQYLSVISAEAGITYDTGTAAQIKRAIKDGVSVLPMSQLWGLCSGVVSRAAKIGQGVERGMEIASREVPHKLWDGIERRVKAESPFKGNKRPKIHGRSPVMELFSRHFFLTETIAPSLVKSRLVKDEDKRWVTAFLSSKYASAGGMMGDMARLQYSGKLPDFFVKLKTMLELGIDLENSIRMSVDSLNRADALENLER